MAETVNYLSYYHPPDIENLFILRIRKSTDKDLKKSLHNFNKNIYN